MPRSRRVDNNNYLRVRNTADPWLDAGGTPSRSGRKREAIFTDPAWGVRAGILQLRIYFLRHDLRTVAKILALWPTASDALGSAPVAPSDPADGYTEFVTGRIGVGPNTMLALFKPDASIDDLGQLRALFRAMAAFENGGSFRVPARQLDAGLELVEPGITQGGTTTPHADPDSRDIVVAELPKWIIRGSVGAWRQGAKNAKADVKTVQDMLRQLAMILGNPRIDPGSIDGVIARTGRSDTVQAIRAFQSRFQARPDGLVRRGRRTWRELIAALEGAATGDESSDLFPFTQLPKNDWTTGAAHFGADRGGRAHAACDLYFPAGTIIHAIADGEVIGASRPFYLGTNELRIDHGSFVARYGEIQSAALVGLGEQVKAGQPIAKVGDLEGITESMLHLELYDGSAHGELSVAAAESRMLNGLPTFRRRDLIDPTPHLNQWKNHLAGTEPRRVIRVPSTRAGVPKLGFGLVVKRSREERRAGTKSSRTVGVYQGYWNGEKIDGLSGQMVERGGPGDNTAEVGENRRLRLREGIYPISVHAGSGNSTNGYSTGTRASDRPKPALALAGTGERSMALINAGRGYLPGPGCLSPARGVADADADIAFAASRTQTIEIIDALRAKLRSKFPPTGIIPDAHLVIKGEPAR